MSKTIHSSSNNDDGGCQNIDKEQRKQTNLGNIDLIEKLTYL